MHSPRVHRSQTPPGENTVRGDHAIFKAVLRLHHDEWAQGATLYTGITGDLRHRTWQHKNKLVPGFTSHYNLIHLVYYECFVYPGAAIKREKEIKGWRRSKKVALIEAMNPRWEDLAESWQDFYKPGGSVRREVPRCA